MLIVFNINYLLLLDRKRIKWIKFIKVYYLFICHEAYYSVTVVLQTLHNWHGWCMHVQPKNKGIPLKAVNKVLSL